VKLAEIGLSSLRSNFRDTNTIQTQAQKSDVREERHVFKRSLYWASSQFSGLSLQYRMSLVRDFSNCAEGDWR